MNGEIHLVEIHKKILMLLDWKASIFKLYFIYLFILKKMTVGSYYWPQLKTTFSFISSIRFLFAVVKGNFRYCEQLFSDSWVIQLPSFFRIIKKAAIFSPDVQTLWFRFKNLIWILNRFMQNNKSLFTVFISCLMWVFYGGFQ
jgi:hypothetical protein